MTDTTGSPGQTHIEYARSAGHIALEVFGIAASLTSVVVLLWRAAEGVIRADDVDGDNAGSALAAVFAGALMAGYILADFASGIVHFTFDRFFAIDTPLLGRNFVHPFRQHHSDPKHITRHGFIETNGNNCLATCIPLFTLIAMPFDYTVGWHLFLVVVVVSGAIGTFMTNQFHKWAHAEHPSPVVDWLQNHHLILPRRHHQIHHTHPYNTHYCITTGWLNTILQAIRFWAFLEWFGTKVCRLAVFTEPTPWEEVPGSPAWAESRQMQATTGR